MPSKTTVMLATGTLALATLLAPIASANAQGFPGAKQRDSSPSDSAVSPSTPGPQQGSTNENAASPRQHVPGTEQGDTQQQK
jgi:hypothetical protein